MKKFMSLVLAVLMFSSLCMVVSAETTLTDPGEESTNVKATYEEGYSAGTVHSVDIEWGAMEFTFTDAAEGTWQPDSHTYADTAEASWSANGNTVKVTNHSNTAVDVTFEYSKATGFDSVIGTLDVTSKTLDSAVDTAVADAPYVISTLTLSGTLASDTTAKTVVGTVTVTIA